MTLRETFSALAAAGTEQTRKTYARHGVNGDMFGVSYATLGKLKRSIKVDQALAEELWGTGNHDARVLATMIADPARTSMRLLSKWARDLDNSVLAGALSGLASQTASAQACFEQWSRSKDDFTSAAAWSLVASMAVADQVVPDAFFESQLKFIEKQIHTSKNRTRYSMNGALIAIGTRNPNLEKKALEVAQRIGKVEVDHGDTNCQTPDAAAYIRKTNARKRRTAKKP